MSTLTKSLAACAVGFALAATPAKAQLWYNGNWSSSTVMLPSERDLIVGDSRIYENFLVTGAGWNITSLFGDFLSSLSPTLAYWDIRQGVSAGNGGTVLYSGTSSINWLLLGPGAWGDALYRATLPGLNLTLPAGTYWLTLAPAEAAYARAYIAGTAGAGGVNSLLDGNSYWDSQTFGKNFVSISAQFGSNKNFAYGVNGSLVPIVAEEEPPTGGEDPGDTESLGDPNITINPEPGTVVLMATGLGVVGLGVYRRRRVAQA